MMKVSVLILALSVLCIGDRDNLYVAADDNNSEAASLNHGASCYDCFKNKYPVEYCHGYYYACLMRNRTTDPNQFDSYTREALDYSSYMSFESSMRRDAANSAYCRYYLDSIKDPNKFCHKELGSKLFMTASYLAGLFSEIIKKEYQADSVETVYVAVQKQDDTRSEKKFLRRIMKRAKSRAISRQLDLLLEERTSSSSATTTSINQVQMTEGKRTWSVHKSKNTKLDADKSNLLGKFMLETRLYAQGIYLYETTQIRRRSGNYFIVSIDTSPICTNMFC